jgi:ApbE superfamily uncharacterized protein (UPF0280 family)
MRQPPTIHKLPGDRLHLHHGPIDVILKAWGAPEAVRAATRAATRGFPHVLPRLAEELKDLRKPIDKHPKVSGAIATRMVAACEPFADTFITPMAAVAGAVADALLDVMLKAGPLDRAYVNDGGDIALHVTPGHPLTFGMAGDLTGGKIPKVNGQVVIDPTLGVGGLATSGAQGRSFSLGIADSVTVLARTAAEADAAATLIANAVDCDAKTVKRTPAVDLDADSDLGHRLVVTEVGKLKTAEIDVALDAGAAKAEAFLARGLIVGAILMLRGDIRTVGAPLAQVTRAAA